MSYEYNKDAKNVKKYVSSNNNTSNSKRSIIIVASVVIIAGGIGIISSINSNKAEDSTSSRVSIDSADVSTAASPETERQAEENDNQVFDNIDNSSNENISDSVDSKPTILSIDSIADNKIAIDKIDIQQFSDKISEEKETKTYELTTGEAGTYRFELSNVPQNIWFKFYLYNSSMEQLKYGSGDNSDGITADLNADTKYYFVVEQGGNTGSYTLNIGSQKPTTEISSYTTVSDSTQFTNQRNIYNFTSSVAGTYRFELSNVPQNIWFKFYLYNSSMEQLNYGSGDNGDGITADLDADTEYYFVVEQGGNTGSYTLNVGSQKPITDISSYMTVSDSTQFTNQRNIYDFTSSVAGNYRFELSNVSQDTWFKFYLYNSSMEQLKYGSGDNGDGITADLDADTEYYFVVEQGGNTGSYNLNYGMSDEQ